jgi:hypothetical protein
VLLLCAFTSNVYAGFCDVYPDQCPELGPVYAGGGGGGGGGGGVGGPGWGGSTPPWQMDAWCSLNIETCMLTQPESFCRVNPAQCQNGVPMGTNAPPIIESTASCSDIQDIRGHAARVAFIEEFGNTSLLAGATFAATTADGYVETWNVPSGFGSPTFMLTTTCPNGGG